MFIGGFFGDEYNALGDEFALFSNGILAGGGVVSVKMGKTLVITCRRKC